MSKATVVLPLSALVKKMLLLYYVTEHKIDYNHEFDWDNIEILDTERFYNKRLISENLHIKRQIKSINKQTDTIFFPDLYLPILNKFPT